MRILSFICVMMVVVLNFVPCADVHEEKDAVSYPVITRENQPQHSIDACTPFCHCSCCANTVVVKLTASPVVPIKLTQSAYISHFEGNSLDISQPIFQPPKSA